MSHILRCVVILTLFISGFSHSGGLQTGMPPPLNNMEDGSTVRTWDLIDGETCPLGSPVPETVEIAEMEKEDPPSGDAVGTGDAVILPDGTLLLSNKRYHSPLPGRNRGRRYKTGAVCEVRRSRDWGRTWEHLGAIDPDPEGKHDMTVSLVHPDGAPDSFVRVFVERAGRFFTYCSRDSGETWIDKKLLFDYDNPERGIHLSHPFNGLKKLPDGTILIPMQRCGGGTFYPPVLARCLPQADPTQMGALREHWELIEVGHDLPESFTRGPAAIISESDVVPRPDGSLLWIMRSSCGWMFICESHDNGTNWSRLRRDRVFGCTNSKHHLLKLADGTLLMSHHNANNTHRHPYHKRSPLAVAVSRDGGFTWERSVSVAWKSDWHYGYPKGLELPDGDILYFSRYGENHDARSIGLTRVKRSFLDTASVSQDAEGGHFQDGVFYITNPHAKLTAVNRQELLFPVESDMEFVVDELDGRFQILAMVGEGSMEMVALGVRGSDAGIELEVYDLDIGACQAEWRPLGVSVGKGEACRARLTLQDPWSYQLQVNDSVLNGHTVKPLIPYTAQIGINLNLEDPLRDTTIKARVLRWELSSGQRRYAIGRFWDEARPCYRFITTHFAYDENGQFHGSVPRIGIDLSIPQGRWGAMDSRNPVLVETNTGEAGDGVLVVDKPFRSAEGTVAFWGLPLDVKLSDQRQVLLDCGDFKLGFIGHSRPFISLKDEIIEGDELTGTTGLYAWLWRFTGAELEASFAHISADGDVSDGGRGSIPESPWRESSPRWFNNGDNSAPLAARIAVMGAWQRMLSFDELRQLSRY